MVLCTRTPDVMFHHCDFLIPTDYHSDRQGNGHGVYMEWTRSNFDYKCTSRHPKIDHSDRYKNTTLLSICYNLLTQFSFTELLLSQLKIKLIIR